MASTKQRTHERCPQAPHAGRLKALRAEIAARGCDAYVLPHDHRIVKEYLPPHLARMEWVTGFTGTAGTLVVTKKEAVLVVDDRYTTQARRETDPALIEVVLDETPDGRDSLTVWLAEHLPQGAKLGYDPWLHTPDSLKQLSASLQRLGGGMVGYAPIGPDAPRTRRQFFADLRDTLVGHAPSLDPLPNAVDAIWIERPEWQGEPFYPHTLNARDHNAKLNDLSAGLKEIGVDCYFVSRADSTAWLLDFRGSDTPHTPLPISYAIVSAGGAVRLFCEAAQVSDDLRRHFGERVSIFAMDDVLDALDELGTEKQKVLLDKGSVPCAVYDRLEQAEAKIEMADDPLALPKAIKSAAEIEGIRNAHLRFGAALTRFLRLIKLRALKESISELDAEALLLSILKEDPHFKDLAFPIISAAGPNAGLPHYRSGPHTNRRIGRDGYLVDCGVQSEDGTTDCTRCLGFEPTGEMRDRFTRVLKGHIAVARMRFPHGTCGYQLDCLSRQFLWPILLDFEHGLGHGVGNFLNVHQGPQRVSKVADSQTLYPLHPGMIISNEPGYYKENEFGFRFENLHVVVEIKKNEARQSGAKKEWYGFENLTWVPIDLDLVDEKMMTPDEIAWVDDYHAEVRRKLTPLLNLATAAWLAEVTQPLAHRLTAWRDIQGK